MTNRSPLLIAGAVALAAVAYGVGGDLGALFKNGFGGGFGGGGSSATEASLLAPEDAALSDKLQPYIKCMNQVDTALRNNYAEYRRNYDLLAAGAREGISSLAQFKVEVYEQDNAFSKECATGLDAAVKMQPPNVVLDQNGAVYATTLRDLIPLMNAADQYYYAQKDYLDDDLAKGKELDAQMSPLFDRLFAASDAISAEIDVQSLSLRRKELAAMEAAGGKDFTWQLANVMQEARATIDAIDDGARAGTLSEARVADIEAPLQKAYDEAVAYAAANPDVRTELGNKPLWFDMESYIGNLLGDVKDLRRALATQPMPEREVNAVFEEYNRAIDNYNMRVNIGG